MSFTKGGRDVRIVAGARAVSWLGDEVALVALMLRFQSHGALAVAALMIANTLPLVLLSGVVGRLVDRYDNRRLLLASSAAQAAICVVLAVVSAPAAVFALLAALGAGQAVNSATWSALVPALVVPEELPKAIGAVQAATTLAGIVAPALGGLLYGAYGTRVPLLVDAGSFLVVLVAGLAVRARRVVSAGKAKQRGGLAIVRRRRAAGPAVRHAGPVRAARRDGQCGRRVPHPRHAGRERALVRAGRRRLLDRRAGRSARDGPAARHRAARPVAGRGLRGARRRARRDGLRADGRAGCCRSGSWPVRPTAH